MRVLFVSHHYPADVTTSVSGAFHRMRTWLDAVQASGAEIEILFLAPSDVDPGPAHAAVVADRLARAWGIRCAVSIAPAEPGGRGLLARYLLQALGISRQEPFRAHAGRPPREALERALERSPDVVFLHSLPAMVTARPCDLGNARILLDLPDLEHLKFARDVMQPPRTPLKPLRVLWLPALWWGERAAIRGAHRAFVCSDPERRYLRRTMGLRNVQVIPNAVARVEDGPLTEAPTILYIGTYGYAPNVVAAEHMIRQIWPRLTPRFPEARLLIAGSRPERIPSFAAPPPRVEFLGFVPDLHGLYRRTRIVCCPIQSGGGTRIKILEAASYGIPVVSTTIGAEGLDLAPGSEIIVRDDAPGLAAACAELLSDHQAARAVGARARDRVRTLYSREAVVTQMRSVLSGETADRAFPYSPAPKPAAGGGA